MNFLLIMPYQYDLTEVKIFINSLPPEGRLHIFGPRDSVKAACKVADTMGIPYENAPENPTPGNYSYCRSFEWELDNLRDRRFADLTLTFADEGLLLKGAFPSRFNTRKTFVYCTECNTLLPEDKHIDLIKHCANCCSDRKYLINLSGNGVALVRLYNKLGYHTLTPGGRKAWPYDEKKEDFLFISGEEWRTDTERRRRDRRKSEAKTARPSFRL